MNGIYEFHNMCNLKYKIMKKYILSIIIALLVISCNGQKNKIGQEKTEKSKDSLVGQPKGSWKVDKEFDENGNLIRYDSIYSWSSKNRLDNLSSLDRDSLLQSFKSRFFTNFSEFKNQGFEGIFSRDSLFSKHFFNEDFFGSSFGKDLMDIDKIMQQMNARQKKFLEKYQMRLMSPEEEK